MADLLPLENIQTSRPHGSLWTGILTAVLVLAACGATFGFMLGKLLDRL